MRELRKTPRERRLATGVVDVEITLPHGDVPAAEHGETDSWSDTLLIAALIVVLGTLVVLLGG